MKSQHRKYSSPKTLPEKPNFPLTPIECQTDIRRKFSMTDPLTFKCQADDYMYIKFENEETSFVSITSENLEQDFETSPDSFISLRSFSRDQSSSFFEMTAFTGGFRKRKLSENEPTSQKRRKLEWEDVMKM